MLSFTGNDFVTLTQAHADLNPAQTSNMSSSGESNRVDPYIPQENSSTSHTTKSSGRFFNNFISNLNIDLLENPITHYDLKKQNILKRFVFHPTNIAQTLARNIFYAATSISAACSLGLLTNAANNPHISLHAFSTGASYSAATAITAFTVGWASKRVMLWAAGRER